MEKIIYEDECNEKTSKLEFGALFRIHMIEDKHVLHDGHLDLPFNTGYGNYIVMFGDVVAKLEKFVDEIEDRDHDNFRYDVIDRITLFGSRENINNLEDKLLRILAIKLD